MKNALIKARAVVMNLQFLSYVFARIKRSVISQHRTRLLIEVTALHSEETEAQPIGNLRS
jgi:hypothetical protein